MWSLVLLTICRVSESQNLVTRASRLCGGIGIGLGGEESMTWKPSRLQGVGPMGMLVDDLGLATEFDVVHDPQLPNLGTGYFVVDACEMNVAGVVFFRQKLSDKF